MTCIRVVIAFSVAAMFGVSSAKAQVAVNPAAASKDQKTTEARPAQNGSGVTVFIDPVTHQVRQPSAAEIGELTKAGAESKSAHKADAVPFAGPGGSIGMMLDDSMDVYMVVTKRPDGKLDSDCVTGAEAAAGRVANPKAVAVKPVPVSQCGRA